MPWTLGAGVHSSTTPYSDGVSEAQAQPSNVGITEMAAMAGLSVDTLRWYEKEGLVPGVGRDGRNRRSYSPREQSLVLLLTALRDTAMPTSDMKAFVAMLGEGAASHGRRIALLEAHHRYLEQRRAAIDAADEALQRKVDHYRGLIADGLDCEGSPVTEEVRERQVASR